VHGCILQLLATNERQLMYWNWLQVLNYKTQQSRLFPLLASAYAFRFVGDWLNWLYTDVTQKLEAKDFSTLQEAHACTAGLKAVTTSVTAVCNPCAVLLVINSLYWLYLTLFGSLIRLWLKWSWVNTGHSKVLASSIKVVCRSSELPIWQILLFITSIFLGYFSCSS
jgi:hypothetical protein